MEWNKILIFVGIQKKITMTPNSIKRIMIIAFALITTVILLSSCGPVQDVTPKSTLTSDGEEHTWVHIGGKGDIDLWKVKVDSIEYIVVDGVESVAIIKHK